MNADDTLAFHAAPAEGDEGFVLLLRRTEQKGQVSVRRWSAGAYLEPGEDEIVPAADLAERVAGWERARWRFSETVPRILGWLRDV